MFETDTVALREMARGNHGIPFVQDGVIVGGRPRGAPEWVWRSQGH